MPGPTPPPRPLSPPPRGITQSDVSPAANSLLRSGERPTIKKVRVELGKGSPNTVNPLLDAWGKILCARLDERRRAHQELKTCERIAADTRQNLEVRSQVSTLREGELDSRLRDRERRIADLPRQLRGLTLLLRKEQATRELLSGQLADLLSARPAKAKACAVDPAYKRGKTSRAAPISRRRVAKSLALKRRR